MHQDASKAERYAMTVADLIGPPTTTRVTRRMVLNATAVRDAILMGPNAHSATTVAFKFDAESLLVTFDMVILFAEKPHVMR
jgi:hypothetical protein